MILSFAKRFVPKLGSKSVYVVRLTLFTPFAKYLFVVSLTLFRLGFFGQSVTGGGGGALLGPPLFISGTNNARVMKFTHNDHLRTKKPHTQF